MTTADYKLFTPLTLGEGLELQNRVVFSPLTRARADKETHIPNDMMVEYYAARAGSGLIIAEATAITPQGFGWYGAPAIYNDEQVVAWKKVTDAVHAKNGKIVLQLWHMGRLAHSSFNTTNEVVSASANQLTEGHLRNSEGEYVAFEKPRALETSEIPGIIECYRKSAELAKQAGFDGVEIHSANGYLIDQFLQSVTNQRMDQYGGSFENRARLLIEVVEAIKTVWPSDRIGFRISPNGVYGGMGSADNYGMFMYTLKKLREYQLAYVALLDANESRAYHDKGRLVTVFDTKAAFQGVVIANAGYTRDTAEGALRSGAADAVSFGRPFMANPDLTERFQNDWPIHNEAPHEFWWDADKGAEGYITYKPYQA